MIGSIAIPFGLAWFAVTQRGDDPVWAFFLHLAAAVPLLAFFWGAAAGVSVAIFATAPPLVWSLFKYHDIRQIARLPWIILVAVALVIAALRLGGRRAALDGRLAGRKMRLDDLIARQNTSAATLAGVEARVVNHQHLARQITRLTASVSDFERSLSVARVAETIAARVHEIFGRGRTLLYHFDGESSRLLSAFPSCADVDDFGDDYNPIVRRRRENIMIADTERQYQIFPVTPPRRPFRSCLIVPLAAGYDTWGVLRVESESAAAFSREDLQALVALSGPATLALQNAELFAAIERRAVTDGLTGLYRRHYFDNRLDVELARARRNRGRLTLLFFDVDHFKAVNDTYGHAQGDIILRETAALLAAGAPEGAITARYGGEEFVIILPETPKEEGHRIAEAIRERMETNAFSGTIKRVTISGGVAEYPGDAATPAELTEAADKALYRSKSGGRNRINLA
jgi:diguanylate cyclase (GGDEF)-like protein